MGFAQRVIGVAFLALAAMPAAGQAPPSPPPPMPEIRVTEPAEYGPEAPPRPAIWLLQDADTKIYLFGTFHILPPNFRWRSPLFDDIARRVDELVLEVSDRETMRDPAAMVRPMLLGKQAPLVWRVSPERREALAEMVANIGLPIETFDNMQTWAAALSLSAMQIVSGYGEEGQPVTMEQIPGVEDQLETQFNADRRPISGVETTAEQMGFFGSMSFADQRAYLEAMIDEYRQSGLGDPAATGLDEREWARGNVEAIALEASGMPGPLYDVLLRRRNAAWTLWLADRLERPGTILFAVGAAHLAGPDSVQTMLAARGLEARRIQ